MSNAVERWETIVKTLEAADLVSLAAYVRDESKAAHAAPLSIPVIGETGSGKSALVARIFGEEPAIFPQDVLESTARPVEVKYAQTSYRAVVHGDGEWDECEDDTRWDALVRGREPLSSDSQLEVGLPCEDLKTWNASMVDTPGMNTNTPELEGRAWAAAATAPVVMLAIPASSTGRRTDIDYLKSLGDNSASVVIALTKTDLLSSGEIDRVIDDFRNRLAEHDISPLGILPTSSTEGSGIAELRKKLEEVTGKHREQLVAYHVGGRVAEKIKSELSALQLKQSALESESEITKEEGAVAEGDIIAEGAEQEDALRKATNVLKDRCKRLCLEAFNNMHEIGKKTLQAISDALVPLQTRDEVQHFADGSVRGYVLQWLEECMAAAEDRLEELEQEGVQSAKDVVSQHFKQMNISVDWLQELPEGTVARPAWDSTYENVQRSRDDLLSEIKELQKLVPTGDELDPIQQQLSTIQQQLSVAKEERGQIIYEPVMKPVSLDQGKKEIQEIFGGLGKALDVALTLAPIPTGGKVGVFLKNLPKGQQIIGGINKYNKIIAGRNKLLKKAVSSVSKLPTTPGGNGARGWLMKAVDNLSLETWGERLGGFIGDRVSPDKIVEIEDEQARQEFLQFKKSLDDEVGRLVHEQAKVKSRQNHIKQRLTDLTEKEERVAELEREMKDLEANQQRLEAEGKAAAAKTALMAQMSRQILARDGDSLCADMRRAASAGFDSAREALENHLRERVRAIKSEVQAALKDARAKHAQGEAAVKEALETNQKMRQALESALSQLKAL